MAGKQGPNKAAIQVYLEKKRKEEEAAKEARFKEMLNPYKQYGKKAEPDEEFVKAQKRKERLMKKKEDAEKKLRDKMDKERLKKANDELQRLAKEQEAHRAMEERKKQQEKARKQAIFGKPVDKKMQEYLERIKASREKSKLSGPELRRAEARKREEEKLMTSAKVKEKQISDRDIERERERRILENMRRQQNKSITTSTQKDNKSTNQPSSKLSNGNHVASKKPSSVTTRQPTSSSSSKPYQQQAPPQSSNNRIPKIPKSRVAEYSPTRPSIIEKSHENRKKQSSTIEYSPTKVTKTKEGIKSDAYKSTGSSSNQQYVPSPKSAPISKSGHSNLKENGQKVKSRIDQRGGGGDHLVSRTVSSSSSSFESALNPQSKRLVKPSDNLNAKSSRDTSIKNGKDSLSERERLLRERELEAERELERQRAKNKELEEQLAQLRREREKEQERKQVAVKSKTQLAPPSMPKARKPIASNKILPPIGLTYRRGMNYQPVYQDDDDEEEEDEEMRDFIDDGDDLEAQKNDVSQYIREIFGYDKRKYAMIDDDDIEEASFAQQMKEEMESAKAGLLEDLEDIRKEEEEKRRKAKLKKRRQFIDDSDED